MSSYPPQGVQDAANRLMNALALHEDARDTVTSALADSYDTGFTAGAVTPVYGSMNELFDAIDTEQPTATSNADAAGWGDQR